MSHFTSINRKARPAGVLLGLALLSGCMTARLEENRTLATHVNPGEAVVLLAKPQVEGAAAEDEFMDCVGDRIASRSGIRIASNNDFQDSLFPWFEPSTAPQRVEGLSRLLARSAVRERIHESGVRYVVWVDGTTRTTDSAGSMSCAIGPGVAGCIGFGRWEKESDYDATVWDLQEKRSAGSVSTNVSGTSMIVGVVVPLPFIARVQATACDRLAEQLGDFLQGKDAASVAGAGGG
jgi:hypothetical protein